MSSGDKYNKRKYSVNILGEEQTVVAEVDQEYIGRLADYINEVGYEITKAYPRLPRRHLIGLTLINLADELFKLKEDYDQDYTKKDDQLEELKQEKQEIAKKNRELRQKNAELKEKNDELKEENAEIMALLEEVD